MNKKELFEKIKEFPYSEGVIIDTVKINRTWLLRMIKELEPEKVKVPQFVAEYIEKSRLKGWDLLASMCFVLNEKNKKTTKWLYLGENKNIFALAWIYGYTVEKEPKYKVKVKNTDDYLNETEVGFHFFNNSKNNKTFTRKELEYSDFAWVLDCPGIELEEVTECHDQTDTLT